MDLDKRRQESRDYWDSRASEWDEEYERVWRASRGVSDWLIDRLQPKPGHTILELAAGTGKTGFMAAERIGARGKLISTDFSNEMVEIARRRAKESGVTTAEFRVMDAEAMDLPDASVDGVICRWGLMLMFDTRAVASEVRRVLRAGGIFVFTVWGPAIKNPWTTLIGPVLVRRGLMEPADSSAPGGMFSLSDQKTNDALVSSAGFTLVDFEEMALTWSYENVDHYWRTVSTPATPLGAALKALNDDDAADLRDEVKQQLSDFTDASGSVSLPALALNVAAE